MSSTPTCARQHLRWRWRRWRRRRRRLPAHTARSSRSWRRAAAVAKAGRRSSRGVGGAPSAPEEEERLRTGGPHRGSPLAKPPEMVLLSGADASTRVLGLADLTYNLRAPPGSRSTPFAPGARALREVGTGDTVLGSVGALCAAARRCASAWTWRRATCRSRSDASASAEELVAAAGATLERERHVCSLATMRCAWRQPRTPARRRLRCPRWTAGTRLRLRRDPLGDGGARWRSR